VSAVREIEFRDALREAMSEEMRRDKRVMLMGEEVAQYNGAYKVSRGMLDELGLDGSSTRPSPRAASPAWRSAPR
jgi:pyruvate/2-oxoglutarate/acetoin dehydrogenase E1 component